MKIVQLTAENVKKLRAIEIAPKGAGFVLVTGRNGSGKSSVLDAIWYALGGQRVIPDRPIRDGCEKARIRLNLGELIVERKFSGTETTIKVSNAQGAVYETPQAILDALVGELTFDPLEFARMKPKAQFEALREAAKVAYDFEEADNLDRGDYAARTEVGRELKMLEGQLAGHKVPENAPTAPVDVQALMAEFQRIASHNQSIELQQGKRRQLIADRRRLENEIARLQEELTVIDDTMRKKLPERIDPAEVQAAINGAQEKNNAFLARKLADDLRTAILAARKQAEHYTTKMDARQLERMTVLAEAELPAGLTFGNGEILLNGMPFEQASSAEQLRASCQVAMAANPKLRVLRIKDGSLLDADSLRILEDMTAAADYQVWCERVDTTGQVGVYLEDGTVIATDGAATPTVAPTAAAAPKRRKTPLGKRNAAEANVEPAAGLPGMED